MSKTVSPKTVWSQRKAFLVGAFIGTLSVVGLWTAYGLQDAQSDVLFFVLFFLLVLGLPIAALAASYHHVPRARLALLYAAGFGLTLNVKQWPRLIAEYGPWKGKPVVESIALILLHAKYLLITLAVSLGMGMIVWGTCRLLRGRIAVLDSPFCPQCDYNLTGNVSSVCPECGTAVDSRDDEEPARV